MEEEILTEDSRKKLINGINSKGVILEERTWKLIQNFLTIESGSQRYKLIYYSRDEKIPRERIEIDVYALIDNKKFIIECKRSKYSWFFLKNVQSEDAIYHLIDSKDGIVVQSISTNKITSCESNLLCIKQGQTLPHTNNKDIQVSYKELHDSIRQVLQETEAVMYEHTLNNRRINPLFIPIIVTNADIFIIHYDDGHINMQGDLTDITSICHSPYLAYNFPEVLTWDTSRDIIKNY